MNKATISIDVRRKIRQGHTIFDKPTVLALLERIIELEAQLKQPALPLETAASPTQVAE